MASFDPGARKVEAVVVGASAGGVEALSRILAGLPGTIPLSIVVVLHLPEGRESQLAELFDRKLALAVSEARDKEAIARSHVYFAPPGYHLAIEADRVFSLSTDDPVNFSRPSIDVLMESAADTYGENLLGILLTGSNCDGAAGMRTIKDQGGLTIAQGPLEAHVPVMPQTAIDRGAADYVFDLTQIHRAVMSFATPV